jgi:enoyl-CoA hydratase/carnithine racemase
MTDATIATSRYDYSGYTVPVHVVDEAPGVVRATFVNPPMNMLGPGVHAALRLLVQRMETDPDLKVVIFDSADPDYFLSQLDVQHMADVPDVPGAAALSDTWHDLITRMAHAPVFTIASIRGRTRGIGNEFAIACDMRFASVEKGIFSQPEIGFGVIPGGGGFDWLPRLLGRSRALEVLASGDDFDAVTAAQYGWINRAVPDADLDAFVDRLAARLGGFDKRALSTVKRLVNERVAPPAAGELLQSFREILDAIATPEAQKRFTLMAGRGWGQDSEADLDISEIVGTIGAELAADSPAAD